MRKLIREQIFVDDEYYYIIIRKNIKKYRIEKKLTQQELADITGLSREYICDIENDKKNKHFSILVLTRISFALGVNIDLFFIS